MELILPCLYSELEGTALPKIVDEISKTKYLDHIIIGLDKANETFEAKKIGNFLLNQLHCFILWNDGPKLKKLDQELQKIILLQVSSEKVEMFPIVLECVFQEIVQDQLLSRL